MKIVTSVSLLLASLISGCTTNPANLATPEKISCVNLKEAISFSAKRGLYNYDFFTKLNAGIYVSEKVDATGTYFRGPSGALSTWNTAPNGVKMTYDGGFWIPNSPTEPPRIYYYVSYEPATVAEPISTPDCKLVAYEKDLSAQKVNVLSFATAGATGGIAGRALAPRSGLSYGNAAAGGAASGAIIAAVINYEIGNIMLFPPPEDSVFSEKLKNLAGQKVWLNELQK